MSLDPLALSRKVAAKPWFRWVAGILAEPGNGGSARCRVMESEERGLWRSDGWLIDRKAETINLPPMVPDLADLGTLLLVCDQLQNGCIVPRKRRPDWTPGSGYRSGYQARVWRDGKLHSGRWRETLLEALADALEMEAK